MQVFQQISLDPRDSNICLEKIKYKIWLINGNRQADVINGFLTKEIKR